MKNWSLLALMFGALVIQVLVLFEVWTQFQLIQAKPKIDQMIEEINKIEE